MTPSTQSPGEVELIARLRQVDLRWNASKGVHQKRRRNPDGPEAADTIERLTERVARMDGDLRAVDAQLSNMVFNIDQPGYEVSRAQIIRSLVSIQDQARLSRQDPKEGG